jgi:poly-beta-1,6-N-acetyl-D-glucosamine synthase
MNVSHIVTYVIIVLGAINLMRMGLFMIGSDLHDIRRHRNTRRQRRVYEPFITVLIPAHNEAATILRALASVYENRYKHKEVIVIDDGSTDRTAEIVENIRQRYSLTSLRLIRQTNQGKAVALNQGIAQARGELITVLDSDSTLTPNALSEITTYFHDPRVVMAASNVKIMPGRGLLNLAQRFEYMVGHRVKRSLTTYNCEYIIGGGFHLSPCASRRDWQLRHRYHDRGHRLHAQNDPRRQPLPPHYICSKRCHPDRGRTHLLAAHSPTLSLEIWPFANLPQK